MPKVGYFVAQKSRITYVLSRPLALSPRLAPSLSPPLPLPRRPPSLRTRWRQDSDTLSHLVLRTTVRPGKENHELRHILLASIPAEWPSLSRSLSPDVHCCTCFVYTWSQDSRRPPESLGSGGRSAARAARFRTGCRCQECPRMEDACQI